MKRVIPQLSTERLLLKEITEKDTSLIVKWRSNPDVYKYFLSPYSLGAEEHLRWYYDKYKLDENCFNWMAIIKKTESRIGVFGIRKNECNMQSAEISYILAPEYQRKGYAQEAVVQLMKFARYDWRCVEIVAEIHVDNQDSLRFARNLGFNYVGRKGEFALYKKQFNDI